jgi:lysozyme
MMQQLLEHEGERLMMYKDSVGKWTVGVGHNIEDKGIPKQVSDLLLEIDLDEHMAELDEYLPWWRQLDEVRQLVVVDMAFNLGVKPPLGKLLGFKNTLKYMQQGLYDQAADGMESSLWAKQVGKRAKRLAQMMRTGEV